MSSKALLGSYACGVRSGRSSAARHGFRVGDVVYIACGHDKTIVQFFEVVRVAGGLVYTRQRKTEVTRVAGQIAWAFASPGDGFESDADGVQFVRPAPADSLSFDGHKARRYVGPAGVPCSIES